MNFRTFVPNKEQNETSKQIFEFSFPDIILNVTLESIVCTPLFPKHHWFGSWLFQVIYSRQSYSMSVGRIHHPSCYMAYHIKKTENQFGNHFCHYFDMVLR